MPRLVWGGCILLTLATLAGQPDREWDPLPADERIEELTRSTLSRPEFQQETRESLWESSMATLGAWLSELFSGSLLGVALACLLLGVVALAIGVALLSLFQEGSLPPLSGLRSRTRAWRGLEGAAESWEEAMLKAREALAAGRVYNSLWIAHRAFLSLLDQRGVVDFAKWKTNLDYLREVPRDDPAFPLFRAVSHAYDNVVYAHRSLEIDRLADLLDQIEATRRG